LRKRKVTYPPPRTATRQPRFGGEPTRPTLAAINLSALEVRDDLKVGDRVRIQGSGLYAGEIAVVESLVMGVIPAAVVRTMAGQTRRARSVDLERLPPES